MKQTFLNSDRFQDKRKDGNLKSSYIQDRNKDSNLKSVIEVVLKIIGNFWNRTIGTCLPKCTQILQSDKKVEYPED